MQEKNTNDALSNNRIALLNLWNTKNYGAILTSYGLQYFLRSKNYDSTLVHYLRHSNAENPTNVFEEFAIAELSTTHYIESYKNLTRLNDEFDTFIVGSDQVWRAACTFSWDYFFFLDFAKKGKRKIACAASFGKNELARLPNVVSNISKLIKRFDFISVREASGVDICRSELGVEAVHFLDPVFYLNREAWSQLADKSSRHLPEKYVATYLLDAASVDSKISQLTDGVCAVDILKDGANDASVYSWLKAIRDCSCLVTDSFHGMCFGIIFNKPMVVLANYHRGLDRFTSVLEQFSLMDLLVDNIEEITPVMLKQRPLDEAGLQLLDKYVAESTNALLEALKLEPKEDNLDIVSLGRADTLSHYTPYALYLKVKSLVGYFCASQHNKPFYKELYKDLRVRIKGKG